MTEATNPGEAGAMISIKVNGDAREVRAGLSITALLQELEIQAMRIAVAKNGEVIPKASHGETAIEEGDAVEIVRMVGGG